MHTPKVIIHRLDAPWVRECRRHRHRVQRGLLMAAAAVAGFVALIGSLAAADDSDTAAPRSTTVHSQPINQSSLPAWTMNTSRAR